MDLRQEALSTQTKFSIAGATKKKPWLGMLRAERKREKGFGGNWGWKETEEFSEDSDESKRIAGTGGTVRWKEGI